MCVGSLLLHRLSLVVVSRLLLVVACRLLNAWASPVVEHRF